MITTIATVTVFVENQERAKAFYTEKLGFELINDSEMFPGSSMRWITVAPKDCPTSSPSSPSASSGSTTARPWASRSVSPSIAMTSWRPTASCRKRACNSSASPKCKIGAALPCWSIPKATRSSSVNAPDTFSSAPRRIHNLKAAPDIACCSNCFRLYTLCVQALKEIIDD